MDRNLKIKIWGVRGSFPVANANFLEYGGNTACIAADCGGRIVVFDAGSGLMALGNELYGRGKKRADILLSHLHMDHCMGLFHFQPVFDPDAEIHLYGGRGETRGLGQCLETLIGPPYWPLGFPEFPARVEVHEIVPGEAFSLAAQTGTGAVPAAGEGNARGEIAGVKAEAGTGEGAVDTAGEGRMQAARDSGPQDCVRIRTMPGNHPNQSLLYRLEYAGKSIVYALDCEMNRETSARLSEFAEKADLLIWDGNFAGKDLECHRGWGHSSWEEGIALRRESNAKRVLMTHYASSYPDDFLREQEQLAMHMDPACCFAREGMELLL